mmetsp:Transcript_1086/g.2772  ORF Transcript_1086/g.2772 Transcript_1086/m.2772 type:complete len:352 (+) Transcript_1086:379-1434(+)
MLRSASRRAEDGRHRPLDCLPLPPHLLALCCVLLLLCLDLRKDPCFLCEDLGCRRLEPHGAPHLVDLLLELVALLPERGDAVLRLAQLRLELIVLLLDLDCVLHLLLGVVVPREVLVLLVKLLHLPPLRLRVLPRGLELPLRLLEGPQVLRGLLLGAGLVLFQRLHLGDPVIHLALQRRHLPPLCFDLLLQRPYPRAPRNRLLLCPLHLEHALGGCLGHAGQLVHLGVHRLALLGPCGERLLGGADRLLEPAILLLVLVKVLLLVLHQPLLLEASLVRLLEPCFHLLVLPGGELQIPLRALELKVDLKQLALLALRKLLQVVELPAEVGRLPRLHLRDRQALARLVGAVLG